MIKYVECKNCNTTFSLEVYGFVTCQCKDKDGNWDELNGTFVDVSEDYYRVGGNAIDLPKFIIEKSNKLLCKELLASLEQVLGYLLYKIHDLQTNNSSFYLNSYQEHHDKIMSIRSEIDEIKQKILALVKS